MINFRAHYISPATIKYTPENNKTIPKKVAFVEMDSHDQKDLFAMKITGSTWDEGMSFAQDIFEDACSDCNTFYRPKESKPYFYAITEQKKEFDKMDSSKILGLAEIQRNSKDLIRVLFFQVNPAYYYFEDNSKYRHIGTALMDSIKNLYNKSSIVVNPAFDAIEFYKKNGFKKDDLFKAMLFKR